MLYICNINKICNWWFDYWIFPPIYVWFSFSINKRILDFWHDKNYKWILLQVLLHYYFLRCRVLKKSDALLILQWVLYKNLNCILFNWFNFLRLRCFHHGPSRAHIEAEHIPPTARLVRDTGIKTLYAESACYCLQPYEQWRLYPISHHVSISHIFLLLYSRIGIVFLKLMPSKTRKSLRPIFFSILKSNLKNIIFEQYL